MAAVSRGGDFGRGGPIGTNVGLNGKTDKVILEDTDIPTNSRFRVSKTSNLYAVNPTPKCWLDNCRGRNNKRTYKGCTVDGNDAASEWNILGARAMERYVDGDLKAPGDFTARLQDQAFQYFTEAVKADGNCKTALLNLAIVETRLGKIEEAKKHYEKV